MFHTALGSKLSNLSCITYSDLPIVTVKYQTPIDTTFKIQIFNKYSKNKENILPKKPLPTITYIVYIFFYNISIT